MNECRENTGQLPDSADDVVRDFGEDADVYADTRRRTAEMLDDEEDAGRWRAIGDQVRETRQ